VEFLIDKTKLLDRLKGRLNARQEKALLCMFREGLEGFRGFLRESTARSPEPRPRPQRATWQTWSRGALPREGERRYARYRLSVPIRPVQRVTLTEQGDVVEH
jgi:hypothetical protein